jgi:hypothetical protein
MNFDKHLNIFDTRMRIYLVVSLSLIFVKLTVLVNKVNMKEIILEIKELKNFQ